MIKLIISVWLIHGFIGRSATLWFPGLIFDEFIDESKDGRGYGHTDRDYCWNKSATSLREQKQSVQNWIFIFETCR